MRRVTGTRVNHPTTCTTRPEARAYKGLRRVTGKTAAPASSSENTRDGFGYFSSPTGYSGLTRHPRGGTKCASQLLDTLEIEQ